MTTAWKLTLLSANAQMMFYLWPKYTAVVQKSIAEFMKRAGAGDTPKDTLKDLPQRMLARRLPGYLMLICFVSNVSVLDQSGSICTSRPAKQSLLSLRSISNRLMQGTGQVCPQGLRAFLMQISDCAKQRATSPGRCFT